MFKRLAYSFVIVFIGILGWYFFATQPVTGHFQPPVNFEILPGQNLDAIGNNLSQAQLIRSRAAFKITVIRLGISSKIQAGQFNLSPNMTVNEIALKLTKAQAKQIRVTLPEGLRHEEIANIIGKAFLKQNPSTIFNSVEFSQKTASLEGRLFPDTYDFAYETTTQGVIDRLISRYEEVVTSLNIPADILSSTTILASLLEREAANSTEMPEVAGVLQNRLNKGWPLQVDATVQYALSSKLCRSLICEWWPKSLSRSDLQIKSSLNTYLNPGLPSAPISNPGKDSLQAAAKPAASTNWFYLHDSDGKIHFAATIEQHNKNICIFLKKDCR